MYNGETVAILNEFEGRGFWFDDFKRVCDKWSTILNMKGASKKSQLKMIIFTSNMDPEEWWNRDKKWTPTDFMAFRRRVDYEVKYGWYGEEVTATVMRQSGRWSCPLQLPIAADAIPKWFPQPEARAEPSPSMISDDDVWALPAPMPLPQPREELIIVTDDETVPETPSPRLPWQLDFESQRRS